MRRSVSRNHRRRWRSRVAGGASRSRLLRWVQLFFFAVVPFQHLDGLCTSSCLPSRDPGILIRRSYRRETIIYRPAPGLGKPETVIRST
jgi:hypothetical protein